MNKKLIRLTESDLHEIVKESVNRVLNEKKIQEGLNYGIDELFDKYDTDTISVSDFRITYQGILIDYIHRDNDGEISIWSGNPDNDKYAEELLPNRADKRNILELIWEYMS